MGVATFLIGIGIIINAMFFTKPRNQLEDHSPDARAQNLLDAGYKAAAIKIKRPSATCGSRANNFRSFARWFLNHRTHDASFEDGALTILWR